MSCEYCEKGEPLLQRRSRKVKIEDGNRMVMWWCRQNGKWRMEWEPINYCPKCGERLVKA